MPIKVVAVDDHPLLLKQLEDDFASQPDIDLVGTANHINKLMRMVRTTRPNVAVVDPGMPEGLTDAYFFRQFRKEFPEVQIIILTGYYLPAYIREVISTGVLGFIVKNDDLSLALHNGVRLVHQKRRFYSPTVIDALFAEGAQLEQDGLLTEQQRSVLRLASQGFVNSKIGEVLGVTENRIRNILSQVYDKLGIKEDKNLNPRMAAVDKARKLGLLVDEQVSL